MQYKVKQKLISFEMKQKYLDKFDSLEKNIIEPQTYTKYVDIQVRPPPETKIDCRFFLCKGEHLPPPVSIRLFHGLLKSGLQMTCTRITRISWQVLVKSSNNSAPPQTYGTRLPGMKTNNWHLHSKYSRYLTCPLRVERHHLKAL